MSFILDFKDHSDPNALIKNMLILKLKQLCVC